MIYDATPVNPDGDRGPYKDCNKGMCRVSRPGAEEKHPHIDVSSAAHQSERTIESAQLIEFFAKANMDQIVAQTVDEIAGHQTDSDPQEFLIAGSGVKREGDAEIPGLFHEKIENMLHLSQTGELQSGAGQFAVDAVEDLHGICQKASYSEVPVEKKKGNKDAQPCSKKRNLIRCNSRGAEPVNKTVLEYGP